MFAPLSKEKHSKEQRKALKRQKKTHVMLPNYEPMQAGQSAHSLQAATLATTHFCRLCSVRASQMCSPHTSVGLDKRRKAQREPVRSNFQPNGGHVAGNFKLIHLDQRNHNTVRQKKTPADSFDKSVNSFFIRARIKN